jgi:hypothetical protein
MSDRRLKLIVIASVAAFIIAMQWLLPANAEADTGNGPCGAFCPRTTGDGLKVRGRSATKQVIAEETARLNNGMSTTMTIRFTSTVHCPDNAPDSVNEAYCRSAIQYCLKNWPGSIGPLVQIWDRAEYSGGKPPGAWRSLGLTCYTDLIPGRPVLSLAQIRDAFHHTPFSKPGLRLQPKGNLTLVTLPAYYQVQWPSAGFQPGEVDVIEKARMLGNTVRIKPTLVSYRYHFGDGTSQGPTTSPGGTYPTGDVTHAYDTAGTYPTNVDIIYSADFSINGSAWIPIRDTVTITGPPQILTVTTAVNRLYNN